LTDVTDHNNLLSDLVLQTAVVRDQPLPSRAALSRLETSATPELAARLNEFLLTPSSPATSSRRASWC
jgi:hypothetical protein